MARSRTCRPVNTWQMSKRGERASMLSGSGNERSRGFCSFPSVTVYMVYDPATINPMFDIVLKNSACVIERQSISHRTSRCSKCGGHKVKRLPRSMSRHNSFRTSRSTMMAAPRNRANLPPWLQTASGCDRNDHGASPCQLVQERANATRLGPWNLVYSKVNTRFQSRVRYHTINY